MTKRPVHGNTILCLKGIAEANTYIYTRKTLIKTKTLKKKAY